MRPVTGAFLNALRGPHTPYIRVRAWRDGVQVGGVLNVLDGSVTAEASPAGPRRTLSVEFAPAKGLWDALAPTGTKLLAYRGVRYVNGNVEQVQVGEFYIDEQSLDYGPGGGLSCTAPDLWARVQRARFETPRTTSGLALDNAVTLTLEATGGTTATLAGDFTATSRKAIWERDREEAISALAHAAGAWVYIEVDGNISTRAVPSLSQPAVWTIDASASGVLLDASRSRSRQRTYNVVVVSAEQTDGTAPFTPVTVEDSDSASPTYTGGPFGRVPFFYSSPLITTSAQATKVGKSILRRVTGLAAQVELTNIVNPALEVGDVLHVLLPGRDGDVPVVESHLIDALTTPLTPGGTQTIRTRSTRPEGDVPAET